MRRERETTCLRGIVQHPHNCTRTNDPASQFPHLCLTRSREASGKIHFWRKKKRKRNVRRMNFFHPFDDYWFRAGVTHPCVHTSEQAIAKNERTESCDVMSQHRTAIRSQVIRTIAALLHRMLYDMTRLLGNLVLENPVDPLSRLPGSLSWTVIFWRVDCVVARWVANSVDAHVGGKGQGLEHPWTLDHVDECKRTHKLNPKHELIFPFSELSFSGEKKVIELTWSIGFRYPMCGVGSYAREPISRLIWRYFINWNPEST